MSRPVEDVYQCSRMTRMKLNFAILGLLFVLTVLANQDVSDKFTPRLKKLEEKVGKEVQGLKQKISVLEDELIQLRKQSDTRMKRQVTSREVAFSAAVSAHIKNLGTNQTIIFSTITTNIGNHYNGNSGIFQAPVAGTYLFFANILSEDNNNIETEIVHNGNTITQIYSGGSGGYHGSGSNLVILELNPEDQIWVRVHGHFSSNMALHCCWSTFSGYLLHVTDSESWQTVG